MKKINNQWYTDKQYIEILNTKIKELEEKNKTFEDYNKDLNKQLDKLEEENKKLNELVQFNVKTTATLTKKINKAIEYIENIYNNKDYIDDLYMYDLLKILKGEEQ